MPVACISLDPPCRAAPYDALAFAALYTPVHTYAVPAPWILVSIVVHQPYLVDQCTFIVETDSKRHQINFSVAGVYSRGVEASVLYKNL